MASEPPADPLTGLSKGLPPASTPGSAPVAVVTGATAGIGRETARGLARRGYRLVLVGRSPDRLLDVRTSLLADGAPTVETVTADLACQSDIRRAGAEIGARHAAIDVLVNNAGAMFGRRQDSPDGVEMTLAVNHLAYVLLTRCLEGPLQAAGGRVVWVASRAHRRARPETDWQFPRLYTPVGAYCRSKLANILAGYAYARRLAGRGVTLNLVHPGLVATDIGTSNRAVPAWAWAMIKWFALTAEEGARTSLRLATDPDLAGTTGGYYNKGLRVPSSRASQDRAAQEREWQAGLALLGEEDVP